MPGMMPQEQKGQAQGQDQLGDLIKNIGMGLSMFNEALAAVNPELGKEGAAVEQAFASLIDKLSGEGQQSADQGMAPEMAAKGGARPMNPAMRG